MDKKIKFDCFGFAICFRALWCRIRLRSRVLKCKYRSNGEQRVRWSGCLTPLINFYLGFATQTNNINQLALFSTIKRVVEIVKEFHASREKSQWNIQVLAYKWRIVWLTGVGISLWFRFWFRFWFRRERIRFGLLLILHKGHTLVASRVTYLRVEMGNRNDELGEWVGGMRVDWRGMWLFWNGKVAIQSVWIEARQKLGLTRQFFTRAWATQSAMRERGRVGSSGGSVLFWLLFRDIILNNCNLSSGRCCGCGGGLDFSDRAYFWWDRL